MWAANEMWNSSPIETFNFDVSTYMNSTAEAVIKSTTFINIFRRKNLNLY